MVDYINFGKEMDDNKFEDISKTIYFKTILGDSFDLLQILIK